MAKNKISTLGYFVKRLKDSGYIVWKMFNDYPLSDTRKWTILVNPGEESLLVTCMVNVGEQGSIPHFDIYDGANRTRHKNVTVATDSMEVFMTQLIELGVTPDSKTYRKDVDAQA